MIKPTILPFCGSETICFMPGPFFSRTIQKRLLAKLFFDKSVEARINHLFDKGVSRAKTLGYDGAHRFPIAHMPSDNIGTIFLSQSLLPQSRQDRNESRRHNGDLRLPGACPFKPPVRNLATRAPHAAAKRKNAISRVSENRRQGPLRNPYRSLL